MGARIVPGAYSEHILTHLMRTTATMFITMKQTVSRSGMYQMKMGLIVVTPWTTKRKLRIGPVRTHLVTAQK